MDDLIYNARNGNKEKVEEIVQKRKEDEKIKEASLSPISESDVIEKLKEVIDPEVGQDIISMDLLRGIKIEKKNDGYHIFIKMTLTIPGCPLMDMIVADVKYRVSQIPGVEDVDVEIVF